jgi:nucleoside-diphosphate-sugar epimerase
MQVFIAGATGVLGRHLVATLAERGHDVVGLARDDDGAAEIERRGGVARRGDVLDRESLVAAAEGAAVVCNVATAIPTDLNPPREAWARNDRVRREGPGNLLAAARAVGARRFLQEGVVWVARQPDGSAFDEDSPPHPTRITQSSLDAQRLVTDATDLETCVLRCGWLYAPDATHIRQMGAQLRDRKLPIVGGGPLGRRDAVLSYVHAGDAAHAFAAAAEGEATGLFHVVDDEPATFAAFLRTFADELGAPPPRRVPAWLARRFVDSDAVRLLTTSMPTSNDRLEAAFDWTPRYPTYREGLAAVVATWRADGTVG